MSDDRSTSAATDEPGATDDDDSGDDPNPGGGPQRVVSEESVDDILESLDSTPAESPGSESTTATDAPASIDSTPDSVPASTGDEGTDSSDAADPATVDSAAASLPDDVSDSSPDDLAARVEHGDVTGADVRAAEAGEGRESTPEIDDVELSIDDLETTQAGGADAEEDWPDDAGPIAGSVDGGAETGTGDGVDDNPGLLGRLKRFFSR
jgi:hypothetical protein